MSAYRGFGGSGHDELCNRASWRDEDWNSCCVISKVGERIDGSFELTAAKQSWELCMIDDGRTLMDDRSHHLGGDFTTQYYPYSQLRTEVILMAWKVLSTIQSPCLVSRAMQVAVLVELACTQCNMRSHSAARHAYRCTQKRYLRLQRLTSTSTKLW